MSINLRSPSGDVILHEERSYYQINERTNSGQARLRFSAHMCFTSRSCVNYHVWSVEDFLKYEPLATYLKTGGR